MSAADWAAWAAVKSVVTAAVQLKGSDLAAIRDFLVSPDFVLDTYLGAPGAFRSWSHQLRQPILLATHNAVIARAPIEGFLHPLNTLDTLGFDEAEHTCAQ